MKRIMIIVFMLLVAGCDVEQTADEKQTAATERLMAEINQQVGMPNIVNFQQKKLMKLIIEECDKSNLICYVYLKSDYTGKLIFIGKCIGYGVPFSAQFTNPEKIIALMGSGSSPSTIPQPDPNGLFMPSSSSATWLMMIDPATNKPKPVYLEPEIVVSPFPLI